MSRGQKYAIHSPLLLLLCKMHRCRYRVDVSTSIVYLIMGAGALINHITSRCIPSILKLLFLHSSTRKVISTYVDLKSMYRELIIYARRL